MSIPWTLLSLYRLVQDVGLQDSSPSGQFPTKEQGPNNNRNILTQLYILFSTTLKTTTLVLHGQCRPTRFLYSTRERAKVACKKWCMKINLSEGNIFTPSDKCIVMEGEKLDTVRQFCFLGSILPST